MTNYYETTTPPEDQPVSLAEMKSWISMDNDIVEHDELLKSLVIGATDIGQRYTNRTFITTVFTGYFDCLKVTKFENSPFIDIKRAPISQLTSLQIYTNDAWEDFADYKFKPTNGFLRILFPNGVILTDYTAPYAIKIVFPAGYGETPTLVPEGIRAGIKQHVAFLYANRGDAAPDGKKGLPMEVKAMYSKYRILYTF